MSRRRRNFVAVLALASVTALVVWGCLPAETEGKSGNFSFAYVMPDSIAGTGLSTPIAVGARMDLNVFENDGNRTPVTVGSATTANTAVLDVVDTGGDVVTVEAKSAGTTELTVSASGGSDSVDLLTAELGSASLTLPRLLGNPDEADVVFLVGGTSTWGLRLEDGSGNKLVGYGLDVVSFNPESSGGVVASQDVEHVKIRIDAAGSVGVQPSNGQEIVVEAVDPSEVTELTIDDGDNDPSNPLPELGVEQQKILFVSTALSDGRRGIGIDGVVNLVSGSPDVCDVSLDIGSDFLEQLTDDSFLVTAKTAGECQINATLGSLSATVSMTITQ